jgi:hypothetical protein
MTHKQESIRWHCVLRDELGEEFSVTLRAFDFEHLKGALELSYPESELIDVKPLGV